MVMRFNGSLLRHNSQSNPYITTSSSHARRCSFRGSGPTKVQASRRNQLVACFLNHGIVRAFKDILEGKKKNGTKFSFCNVTVYWKLEDVLPVILMACKIQFFAICILPEASLSTEINATLGRLLVSCLVHRLRLQIIIGQRDPTSRLGWQEI